MTVAELAKRFESASLADSPAAPPAIPAGRVRELTNRLEHAVGHGHAGITDNSFGTELSPRQSAHEHALSDDAFPSPPRLPSVISRGIHHAPEDDVASSLVPASASKPVSPAAPPALNLPPEIPVQNNTEHDTLTEHTPEKLTLQQRLARYEQLTSPAPTPSPLQHPSSPTPSPPRTPPPYPSLSFPPAPPTPSTDFSAQTSSLSSDQRIDLIPDVSEGDLDDIEGVERVDDEHADHASTTTDTFEGDATTFRRADTVETLPSEQSHSTLPGNDPPPNRVSSSNASENSSFSSAEFASAAEELYEDRPAPHTLAAPSARRMESNLSAQPHTLHIAPGSFKKLPKAKVMIARRRPDDEASHRRGDSRISHDDVTGRKLIREYENPKELLEGNVSLVELSDDETVEFRDPEISDVRRDTMTRKKHRADAFRHRFDEFMDVQEIERVNEVVDDDAASSKEKYPRRRLFRRGKVEKARQREERMTRQREAAARRSTVISGALDRVSLAADPWIDFITDNNTLPVAKAGGLRRGLKRLFGLGRQNAGLIKSRE